MIWVFLWHLHTLSVLWWPSGNINWYLNCLRMGLFSIRRDKINLFHWSFLMQFSRKWKKPHCNTENISQPWALPQNYNSENSVYQCYVHKENLLLYILSAQPRGRNTVHRTTGIKYCQVSSHFNHTCSNVAQEQLNCFLCSLKSRKTPANICMSELDQRIQICIFCAFLYILNFWENSFATISRIFFKNWITFSSEFQWFLHTDIFFLSISSAKCSF